MAAPTTSSDCAQAVEAGDDDLSESPQAWCYARSGSAGSGGGRSWWHSSRSNLHRTLTVAYFDRFGIPHVS